MRRIIICAALLAMTNFADARRVHQISYQELLDKSDLVVIAEAESTQDTRESIALPYSIPTHAVGLSTTFRIGVVLKGDTQLHTCVVHHYRLADADSGAVLIDGPDMPTFDTTQHSDYLLFLTREADGRYAPLTAPNESQRSIYLIRSHTRLPN